MGMKSAGSFVRDTWATLRGKPATFPPSAHSHAWSEIAGKPTAYPVEAHTHAWGDITGKPSAFPPAAHNHLKADITDFPTTWAWAALTGVPASFPPSAHGHAIGDVTGLQTALDAINAKKTLQLLGTDTVGETTLISLSLGVRRYSRTLTGAAVGDRLVVTLNGIPQNGSLQDVYATAANTISVGVLAPALGIGAVISVPIAIYKVV